MTVFSRRGQWTKAAGDCRLQRTVERHRPTNLQIFWSEPGVLGNSSEHSWTNFLAIVKCEDVV